MSNSLGTLSGALILQEALDLTFAKRPALGLISKGFKELDGSVQNALLGQSVVTRVKSLQTVNAFGTGPGSVTDSDVSVTLANMKEIHVQFTAAQINSTNRDLIREVAEPIAVTLGNYIVDSVATLWNTTNFAKHQVSTTYTRAGLTLPLAQLMDGTSDATAIPQENRFAVLNGTPYYGLLADPIIVAAFNNPANLEAIRSGKLPEVDGIMLDKYPTLGAASINRYGFAGTPDSTLYVARAPKNPTEIVANLPFPGIFDYVEAQNGFRVAVQQWIDPSTLAVNNRLVWLDGYAVGNAHNGGVLTSA